MEKLNTKVPYQLNFVNGIGWDELFLVATLRQFDVLKKGERHLQKTSVHCLVHVQSALGQEENEELPHLPNELYRIRLHFVEPDEPFHDCTNGFVAAKTFAAYAGWLERVVASAEIEIKRLVL